MTLSKEEKKMTRINGGVGNDKLEGGEGIDEIQGGEGADNFICDIFDKIIDFDSQEGDTLSGDCKFEDQSAVNNNVDSSSKNLPQLTNAIAYTTN